MKNDGFVAKYKKTYTIEDANELKEWIAKTKPTGSFDMGHGIKVKNAADYCESILEVLEKSYDNVTFSGEIYTFLLFRQLWEEQHGQTSAQAPTDSSDQ